MMFKPMHKNWAPISFIFALLLLVITVPYSYADTTQGNDPGRGGNEPKSEIYNPYDDFQKEDKLLNESYKSLSKTLEKRDADLFKQAQRKWIKWRDETCIGAQTKANRSLGSFGNSVRDDCLISLTEQRTNEIQQFSKELRSAQKKKFNFSRANDYSDGK